ncbi:hypothetical protein C8F01DRAFT_1144400 [Mycena amicta]|nr:hypothetical protein C8F01DRAFT_1144400 [Mycena amicta]
MSAQNCLSVQELCDAIASFLSARRDLYATALVSHVFASASQRCLFREVVLNQTTFDMEGLTADPDDDEAGKSAQLVQILRDSPRLLAYVRGIRLAFESDVLLPLHSLRFPNLREVVLHRRNSLHIDIGAVQLASKLLALPTIERLGLIYAVFWTADDLCTLLDLRTAHLTHVSLVCLRLIQPHTPAAPLSSPALSTLHVVDNGDLTLPHQKWLLLDASSLLDTSRLKELSAGNTITPLVARLLSQTRSTLTTLSIDAQHTVNATYTDTLRPDILTDFPELKHVILSTHASELPDVTLILSALTHAASVVLDSVTIRFHHLAGYSSSTAPRDKDLKALAGVFEAAWADPERCSVNFVLHWIWWNNVHTRIRELFASHERMGKIWIGRSERRI